MIKVSVMYPTTPGGRFDHDYYRDQHMPLVKRLLGDACSYYAVDKGLAGGAPGAPAPYVAMCHLIAPSLDAFNKGMAVHGQDILADLPNFTDLKPAFQVSEVVVEHS